MDMPKTNIGGSAQARILEAIQAIDDQRFSPMFTGDEQKRFRDARLHLTVAHEILEGK
jgi:hypothetical protein